MNFKQRFLRYWAAMNASAIQCVAHTAKAFFGVAGVHAVQDSVPALSLNQCAGVLLLTFGMGLLDYIDKHPLVDLLPAHDDTLAQINRELEKEGPKQ